MTFPSRKSRIRSLLASQDRRRFLTNLGQRGALLVGATCIARTELEGRDQGAIDASANVRPVQEQAKAVRIFGFVQRAPGLTRMEARRKSYLSFHGYYSAVFQEALKIVDNRSQLIHIENFVTDGAFGAQGQTGCPAFTNRDFVSELSYGIARAGRRSCRLRSLPALANDRRAPTEPLWCRIAGGGPRCLLLVQDQTDFREISRLRQGVASGRPAGRRRRARLLLRLRRGSGGLDQHELRRLTTSSTQGEVR